VKVDGLASKSESASDRFEASIISTRFGSASQFHLALEFETLEGCKLVVHRGCTLAPGASASTSYLRMQVEDDFDLCNFKGMQETLSQPGAKGITKLAAIITPLHLSEYSFGTVWPSIPLSTTFGAQIRVSINAQTRSSSPTIGEVFRLNLIYFVAVLLLNHHILAALLGELLNSRIVRMRIKLDPEIQCRN
jgi:hypothetical protein